MYHFKHKKKKRQTLKVCPQRQTCVLQDLLRLQKHHKTTRVKFKPSFYLCFLYQLFMTWVSPSCPCRAPAGTRWPLSPPWSELQGCHPRRDLYDRIRPPELRRFPAVRQVEKSQQISILIWVNCEILIQHVAEGPYLKAAPTLTSIKLRQPSLGTKAVIFLPFLMSWTLTHFLMAELGCLASTPLQNKNTTLRRKNADECHWKHQVLYIKIQTAAPKMYLQKYLDSV